MSQDLIKHQQAGPLALSLSEQEVTEFQEAWDANITGGGIGVSDLDRIKMVGGGSTQWLVPSIKGEEPTPRIEGVIVFAKDRRAYWKSKDPNNEPPDCSSIDAQTGEGDPGGKCAECPLAKFGSDGKGQACKQMRELFMLRGDAMLPQIVSLPPTSLDAARKFFVKLQSNRIPYFGALVQIELEKAVSTQNKPYAEAKFTHVRTLTPQERDRVVQYQEMCKQFSQRK